LSAQAKGEVYRPMVVVVYIHGATSPRDEINGTFAKVARLLVTVLTEKS
jgi:hypothetical protein